MAALREGTLLLIPFELEGAVSLLLLCDPHRAGVDGPVGAEPEQEVLLSLLDVCVVPSRQLGKMTISAARR